MSEADVSAFEFHPANINFSFFHKLLTFYSIFVKILNFSFKYFILKCEVFKRFYGSILNTDIQSGMKYSQISIHCHPWLNIFTIPGNFISTHEIHLSNFFVTSAFAFMWRKKNIHYNIINSQKITHNSSILR